MDNIQPDNMLNRVTKDLLPLLRTALQQEHLLITTRRKLEVIKFKSWKLMVKVHTNLLRILLQRVNRQCKIILEPDQRMGRTITGTV
jgi:hypothetical protein